VQTRITSTVFLRRLPVMTSGASVFCPVETKADFNTTKNRAQHTPYRGTVVVVSDGLIEHGQFDFKFKVDIARAVAAGGCDR